MKKPSNRLPLIDALRAIASQIVVLHHLSAYGPLSRALHGLAPALFGWLFDYGRIAVQVFLVVGGFLAARALAPDGRPSASSPLPLIGKRYLRLVVPYLVAIGLAVVGAALADQWMDDESIPARATLDQWLAHALLLHGLLGVESLSAGVWYIAIDFQLFALMALLLWAGRRHRAAPLPVLAMACLSLFWFNRHPEWDDWGLYFFGSYGLGAAAWWAGQRRRLALWLGVAATVTIAALVLDFRLRILVALAVALLLGFGRRSGLLDRWPDVRALAFLGRISYSVFLVHFPICLVVNALFVRLGLSAPEAAIFALISALTASTAGGALFYRWIEKPAANRRLSAAFAALPAFLRDAARQRARLAGARGRRLLPDRA